MIEDQGAEFFGLRSRGKFFRLSAPQEEAGMEFAMINQHFLRDRQAERANQLLQFLQQTGCLVALRLIGVAPNQQSWARDTRCSFKHSF
jgi:hypothetical protein